jgi:hypothetical protein
LPKKNAEETEFETLDDRTKEAIADLIVSIIKNRNKKEEKLEA